MQSHTTWIRAAMLALFSSVAGWTQAAPEEIRCGEVKAVNLAAGAQATYGFRGNAGDVICLSLTTTDCNVFFGSCTFSAFADLYRAGDPTPLTSLASNGGLCFELPANTSYTINVHDMDFNSSGSFQLCLQWVRPLGAQCGELLTCPQAVGKNIRSGEQHVYNFLARAGSIWSAGVTTTDCNVFFGSCTFSASMEILSPDLDPANPLVSLPSNTTKTFLIPADGAYTIIVHDSDFNASGGYQLSAVPLDAGCEQGARVSLERLGGADEKCLEVTVQNVVKIRGGELAIAYDDAILTGPTVLPGPDFPADALPDFADLVDFQGGLTIGDCTSGVSKGLVVGYRFSENADLLLAPGVNRLFKICFTSPPGTPADRCSPLKFARCIGNPVSPGLNTVTNEAGERLLTLTADTQDCSVGEDVFRRGDANGDGIFDISDPIGVLICQFLALNCSSCPDASDADDNGKIDLNDAVYLLNWRFQNGPPPSAPFPACGRDPTTDALPACFQRTCY